MIKKIIATLVLVAVCHEIGAMGKDRGKVVPPAKKAAPVAKKVAPAKTKPKASTPAKRTGGVLVTGKGVVSPHKMPPTKLSEQADISELPDTKKKVPESLTSRTARTAGKMVQALPHAPEAISRLKGPSKPAPTPAVQPKKRFSNPQFPTTDPSKLVDTEEEFEEEFEEEVEE